MKAYSYQCRDCEGMEACPASLVAETEAELWQLIGHHAAIAHGEAASDCDDATTQYLETLIKPVTV